jgi:putative endonuclease
MKKFYTYILTTNKNTALYIGVTSDLSHRMNQHIKGTYNGFTKKYHVNKLVYFEMYDYVLDAITREKRLKKWKREWKTKLIEKTNPEWRDMSNKIHLI